MASVSSPRPTAPNGHLADHAKEMESHELYQSASYRPQHALVSVNAGVRCRVCARVFGSANGPFQGLYCGGTICASFPRNAMFLAFVALCVQMQDDLYAHCVSRRGAPEQLGGLTAHQQWWWGTMLVFEQACERSLDVLGPRWRDLLAQSWGIGTFLLHTYS